jgi:U3 small nucleolar RNA-associated protein 18
MALLGQDGNIPLLSLRSRQKIGSLKMNGAVRSGAFGSDGTTLYSCGSDGVIYVWDIRMQRCIKQFVDEGNLGGSSMAVSPSGQIIASGSKNGIVNLYKGGDIANYTAVGAAVVAPVKSLPHLTTTVDNLSFSGDGQILAMSSRMKKESLRLIHMPSMTAFSNWPTSKSPLQYIHGLAFSPTTGYLAIGNAKGRTLLYRLHHFPC